MNDNTVSTDKVDEMVNFEYWEENDNGEPLWKTVTLTRVEAERRLTLPDIYPEASITTIAQDKVDDIYHIKHNGGHRVLLKNCYQVTCTEAADIFTEQAATINKQAERIEGKDKNIKALVRELKLGGDSYIEQRHEIEALKRELSKKNISHPDESMRGDEIEGNMSDFINDALDDIDKGNRGSK